MFQTEEIMKTCCFIGHRDISETKELTEQLNKIIETLVLNENVDTFLFGSKRDFCVFYFNEDCLPKKRKSGTKRAFDYAKRKKKNIIVLP